MTAGASGARGVVAYAPVAPDPDLPWLLEVDAASGAVTAFVAPDEEGPMHARRDRSRRRKHASLAAACAAYGVAPRALALRWWEGASLARVAAMECARLGLGDATVTDPGDVVVVASAAGAVRIANAADLRAWSERAARGAP